jgi:hypothetical protein
MYAVAFEPHATPASLELRDPRSQQIRRVLEAHSEVMRSRDLLYCSPAIRSLIEEDMALLVSLLRPHR